MKRRWFSDKLLIPYETLRPNPARAIESRANAIFRAVYEGMLYVWIDLSSNLISKTEVISTNGKVQHVFAAFDDPIVISDPSNAVVAFHP